MTGYVFDFDGTLVDVWERYWRVFRKCSGIEVGFEKYRRLKLRYSKDGRIAEMLGGTLPSAYFQLKAEQLESSQYLSLDRLVVQTEDILRFFASRSAIVLTARRSEANLRWELERLGLGDIGDSVNVVTPGYACKRSWLEEWPGRWANTIVVGDSPEDMITGKVEGVRTAYVSGGLFAFRAAAAERKPDFTYQNMTSFLEACEIGM